MRGHNTKCNHNCNNNLTFMVGYCTIKLQRGGDTSVREVLL
jgi:hypothetical protein